MPRHETLDVMKQSGTLRRRGADGEHEAADPEVARHPLLNLQRQIGNAQIARLLAQRQEGALPEDEVPIAAKHDPALAQRHEVEDGAIQASPEVGLEGGTISGDLSSRIQAQRGGGSSLDSGVQTSMEGALGDRFDDVRIHTGTEADALNRSVSAKAFTTGSDIFFSQNASPSDTSLLAHELTHVVQQRGSDFSGGPMTVSPAGDANEQAADATASSVTAGAASASAQREAEEADLARMIARVEVPTDEEEVV
jgi:hypothetical protein